MNEMKKFYFIATALLITLGACTNDESAPEQNEIGFKAITTNSTRAILAAGGLPTTESFDVWGYYSTQNENFADIEAGENSNFMKEIKIEYITAETKWRNLARKYYWPSTGKIGFYAMYPSGTYNTYKGTTPTGPDYKNNGIKIVDYPINSTTKYTDLMYGYAESGSISSALTLTFQHALSQVLFNLKTAANYPDVKFYVTKISLKNIDTQAGFQFKLNNTDHGVVPAFDFTTNWSDNEDNQISVLEYYAKSDCEIVLAPADYANASSIVVIPQSLKKTLGSESRLVIDYKMAQGVDTNEDGIGDDVQTGTVEKVLSNTAWEMGKKYIYNLTFNLNEISFDPQVSGWISETAETIDLNIPAAN